MYNQSKSGEDYIEYAKREHGIDLQPMNMMCQALLTHKSVVAFLSNLQTTNAQKVQYCYKLLMEKNLLPQEKTFQLEKSETKSSYARQKGNSYYVEKNYIAALTAYNEALCLAESSESMGLVYANRSAIYLDTGFYSFCLENIQLALDHKYPERLKPKLLQRKAACFAKMKQHKDSYEIYGIPGELKLSYAGNPKIPFVIDALECLKNKKFGRYVVAKKNLKPGDVVLVEEPFVQAPGGAGQPAFYTNCYNCSGNNFFNLKPCPKSPQIMFCCEDCADEAWTRFYKYECPIINVLITQTPDIAAIRATLKAFTMFKDPAELKELVETIDETSNPFECDFVKADEVAKFKVFYGLNTSQHTMLKHVYYVSIVHGAYLFHMFMKFTSLKEKLSTPEYEDLFIELLVRFGMLSAVNGTQINDRLEFDKANLYALRCMGNAVYLVQSMFNHSCAPNVCSVPANFKGKLSVVVLRPIKAGEQVFISYGPSYKSPISERQLFLKERFGFDCKCVACVKNYPATTFETNFVASAEYDLMTKLFPENCPFDGQTPKVAEKIKEAASKLLQRVDGNYPCFDTAVGTKSLVDALHILVFKKPFELIFIPQKQ